MAAAGCDFLNLGGIPAGCGMASSPLPQVQWQPVVSGLVHPVYVTPPGDGSGRLFIVEQAGIIRIFKSGSLLTMPFLDISSKVLSGGEQGLLSVAFHPQYSSNGRFFVNYTATATGLGTPFKSVIAEYHVSLTNPDVADPTTERVLLNVPDP